MRCSPEVPRGAPVVWGLVFLIEKMRVVVPPATTPVKRVPLAVSGVTLPFWMGVKLPGEGRPRSEISGRVPSPPRSKV